MLPKKPEDWPGVFEQHLNAGDLDAVTTLYEPEARFVTKSGETLIGRDRIRKVLGGMIEAKARLHSRVVKAVTVGDIAQLYTDFEGSMNDDSGKRVAIRHQAIEVLRRQVDGTWKLIVGDPNRRESTPGAGTTPPRAAAVRIARLRSKRNFFTRLSILRSAKRLSIETTNHQPKVPIHEISMFDLPGRVASAEAAEGRV